MTVLSNKRQAIHDIFKLMDSSQIGRIDTLELFAPILISIQGKWETILTNAMVIYGFNCETEFSRDEFHFFLDCFFRGLLKLLIVVDKADPVLRGPALSIFSRKKPVPLHAGKRLSPPDLDKLVSQVFPPNIEVLERADFIEAMKQPKEIAEYIKYFNEMFLKSVAAFRQKILDRIHITQFIRKSLLDVQRVVYTKIIEIESAKLALQASSNSQSQPQPSPVMSNGGGNTEQNPQAIQSKNVVQIGDNPRRVFHKDSQRRMWKAVE
ncbi:hypothetical protein FGO68_gene8671 [Halteria grandinella]|uniref:EF-hand domain-containing protein n=1 Tax=Halteria grandinella TaxID=5974 RepID=A0A8J8P1E5_HALGN|nr:hypothetical protein FGO68_gene8671 [Halteria grandinella]